MKLTNHGHIDGIMRDGGEILDIDESQFNITWMEKVVTPEPVKKGILNRLLGNR